ncbi:hypothetical protein EDB89DRAFT_1909001 [Lactarius sanguifluus]|nr:hypothetical protein EDB89DRAFT_1909001 [Lactarius sanguifluus]
MGRAGVELGAGELDKTLGAIGDGSTRSIPGDDIRGLRVWLRKNRRCKGDTFVSLLGMYAAVSTKSTFFGRSDCLTDWSSSHFWIVAAFSSTRKPVINLRYKGHCVDGNVCGRHDYEGYMHARYLSCSVNKSSVQVGVGSFGANDIAILAIVAVLAWRIELCDTRQQRRRRDGDKGDDETGSAGVRSNGRSAGTSRPSWTKEERQARGEEYQEAGKNYEGGEVEVEVEGVKWRTERQELGRKRKIGWEHGLRVAGSEAVKCEGYEGQREAAGVDDKDEDLMIRSDSERHLLTGGKRERKGDGGKQ